MCDVMDALSDQAKVKGSGEEAEAQAAAQVEETIVETRGRIKGLCARFPVYRG